jgi:hypothetical protein
MERVMKEASELTDDQKVVELSRRLRSIGSSSRSLDAFSPNKCATCGVGGKLTKLQICFSPMHFCNKCLKLAPRWWRHWHRGTDINKRVRDPR